MASSFPGAIDDFTDPLSTSPLNSPSHSAQHADLNDAVEKIETFALDLPRGIVALATTTTGSQAGVTTAVDITGMSVTWTAVASRRYKITYHIYAVPTVTNACYSVNLQQGATIKQISIANAGVATVGTTLNGVFVSTFSAGSTTLKLTAALTAGSTGSFTFAPAAVLPYTLLVEDIGKL